MSERRATNQPDTRGPERGGDHSHRPTDENTGKPLYPHDTRVGMYQEPGPAPTRIHHYRTMSFVSAADEDQAMRMENGEDEEHEGQWFRDADSAHRAHTGKGAPPKSAEQVFADTMADLKNKNKDARVAYATVLGVDTKGMNSDQVLEAIGVALKAK